MVTLNYFIYDVQLWLHFETRRYLRGSCSYVNCLATMNNFLILISRSVTLLVFTQIDVRPVPRMLIHLRLNVLLCLIFEGISMYTCNGKSQFPILTFFLLFGFGLAKQINFFIRLLRQTSLHVLEVSDILNTVILVDHVFLVEFKKIHVLYKYISI